MKKVKQDFDELDMNLSEEDLAGIAKMFSDLYSKDIDPALEKAYKWLDKVDSAKSEKEEIKYIHKALEEYPDFFEAKIMLAAYEDNPLKAMLVIEDALKGERELLKKNGFFNKDHIGEFSLILETKPYIHGMYNLACFYAGLGMINKAIDLAREILRLDNRDGSGARYLLMGLYAYMEDESNLKKLYQKYPEESLSMLVPFFVYYYKQTNFKEAKRYLDKIVKCNKHFNHIFDDADVNMLDGYIVGEISEVEMVATELSFLLNTVPGLEDFVLDNGEIE